MVLQEGTSVPIWGWGPEGATVTVQFQNESASAVVKDGKWLVRLGNLKPGAPGKLTVTCGTTITFKDVLVGEVWLASGQSNMEFPLKNSYEAEQAISSCLNPEIRWLKVPKTRLNDPTNNIGASWTTCNPDTAKNFSAVAYYFARNLQKVLNVPVGIIESDWGGSPAEVWMQSDFLHANPDYQSAVFDEWVVAQDRYERALIKYRAKKAAAKEAGTEFTNAAPRQPWKPGELYNGMIAPIAGYAVKGALWYQGEANANNEEDAMEYHRLFPDLIRNWRNVWGEGAFPFLLVQLAPFRDIEMTPSESSWASVREAQLQATEILPNVGMAVITDVGEEHNIHPTHKEPVGQRLAISALGIAYHNPIEYSGPVFKKAKVESTEIVLTFDHVANGLVARGGELTGFAICGADHKFVWANAEIKGKDQVVVHSPLVPYPVAVRYGWANYPLVNLWNTAGLPASPFRTDDFDLIPIKG